MYLLPCVLTLALLAACSPSSVPSQQANARTNASPTINPQEETNYVAVEGLYSNDDYGFSVLVPEGLVGCREPAPLPNHGFGIDLTERSCRWVVNAKNDIYPKSYLDIDASYNGLEWESADDAIKFHISSLKDTGAENISLKSRTSTRLSKLAAVRFVIQYVVSGEAKVEEVVIAFRQEKNADIIYTIDLTTPANHCSEDGKVLADIQRAWSLYPLP